MAPFVLYPYSLSHVYTQHTYLSHRFITMSFTIGILFLDLLIHPSYIAWMNNYPWICIIVYAALLRAASI